MTETIADQTTMPPCPDWCHTTGVRDDATYWEQETGHGSGATTARSWPAVTGDNGRWAEVNAGGHDDEDGTVLLGISSMRTWNPPNRGPKPR